MRKKINLDHITLGVCYYPEHWDASLWKDDLRRMKEMGIETVRIAEFAWNKIEPHEGEFTFEFFDSFMDLALQEGIKVIFCTPSATPPAWMSHNYPEILNADLDGNLIRHGIRRHCNLNSEKYRFFVARITEKLAEHYSRYPNIVAWQLDNEINCECSLYRSESDQKAFRRYLKNQFVTLDALNDAICANFWNQTYTDWEEVYLTRHTNMPGHTNPHMELLERRFVSDTVIDFFKLQTDILRKYTDAPITTNGLFQYVDYHRLTDEVLDFITFDNYPNFCEKSGEDENIRRVFSASKLARTRGISPIFGIMEQQSGPGGWTFREPGKSPKPGLLRLWCFQAVAHGADFVSFFRFRTCSYGTEIYWHGILNYDNRDNRRVAEVRQTYRDLQKIQDVCGKEYVAEVALLRDYENEWDGANDRWHGDSDNVSYDNWFKTCQKKHVPVDLVYVNDETTPDDLKKYKLVVYPHPTYLSEARAQTLRAYVEQGGTVIFGCRTGYKDVYGRCPMMPMPGYAAELCGVLVDDFSVAGEDETVYANLSGRRVSVPVFNDILSVIDGQSLGVYENKYYKGCCAATVKQIGTGKVYYFGGAFGEDAAEAFLDLTGIASPMGLSDVLILPDTVELAIRGETVFLLNYGSADAVISCSTPFFDCISETACEERIVIPPRDVAVLKKL